MKNVQIPYDLFYALLRHHLIASDDYTDEICKGLEQKLDLMVQRELYSKSKTAPTIEERETARKEYLDKKGVPDSFRWNRSR
ncbi:complexin-2 [Robinsoniella peoriensis]|uniref:complexin-2 n=1 Tax=Robinsoniella peoriensis TaxID=180332 RepID=UPI003753C71E